MKTFDEEVVVIECRYRDSVECDDVAPAAKVVAREWLAACRMAAHTGDEERLRHLGESVAWRLGADGLWHFDTVRPWRTQ